ncbi:MAG: nitroreductase [Bacteroidia bacterium]|jgi:nitroreductase
MSIDEIIRNRRSVYTAQLSGGRIEKEVIWNLLENANWAPNHYHTEPWRFIVFDPDGGVKSLMNFMANLYEKTTLPANFKPQKLEKYHARIQQVSHVIAIVMENSYKPGLPQVEEVAATACAVQNLWLTLSKYPNLGGYWSSGALVYTPQMAKFLGLSENQQCLGFFYLGVLDATKPVAQSHRKPIQDKVEWR